MIRPIALFDEVTSSEDRRRASDIVYLDFNNAFNIAPNNILTDKLIKYRLGQ